MSHTAAPSGDLFAERYVDLRADGAEGHVVSGLREHGLVTLDGLDRRAAVLELAAWYLDVTAHPDSDPDGLTVIRDTGRHAEFPGFAGLGNGALAAHTERSGTSRPPRLMLFACTRPAEEGGASLLADGRAVYTDLIAARPDAAEALAEAYAGFFGGQDGVFAPVFRQIPEDRICLRLRLDDLVQWHPRVTPHVRVLTETIARHQLPLCLGAGDAYLLDNSRWLHARTAFFGPRRLYRALGNPRFELPEGFAISQADSWPLPALERS
jgi:hypothetical protein